VDESAKTECDARNTAKTNIIAFIFHNSL